jgi:surfactin synthase thioesterase subunit
MVVQLLCLPFAGAGASFFVPWRSDRVRVHAVQLPGRERRIAEEPYRDVHEAMDAALKELDAMPEGEPAALFGHSLGAVLAYELARRLRAAGRPVAHLFVSGSGGPQKMRDERATGLDDQEFLAKVEEFAGYRHEVLDDPDVREVILPVLRADVEMHENYRPQSAGPIDVPVTAIRGEHDELVSGEQAAQWAAVTTAPFTLAELPGGHMYLTESPDAVLSLVAATVGDR